MCLSFRQMMEVFRSKVVYQFDVPFPECNQIFRFKKQICCSIYFYPFSLSTNNLMYLQYYFSSCSSIMSLVAALHLTPQESFCCCKILMLLVYIFIFLDLVCYVETLVLIQFSYSKQTFYIRWKKSGLGWTSNYYEHIKLAPHCLKW